MKLTLDLTSLDDADLQALFGLFVGTVEDDQTFQGGPTLLSVAPHLAEALASALIEERRGRYHPVAGQPTHCGGCEVDFGDALAEDVRAELRQAHTWLAKYAAASQSSTVLPWAARLFGSLAEQVTEALCQHARVSSDLAALLGDATPERSSAIRHDLKDERRLWRRLIKRRRNGGHWGQAAILP